MRRHLRIGAMIGLLWLGACASPKIRTMPAPVGRDLAAVRTLWIAPSAGVVGDALSVELGRYGFTIIDPATMTSAVVRDDNGEVEAIEPQRLEGMRASGVDAMVFARTVMASYDQRPQSVSVRIVSTADGAVIGGAVWQNGHGGAAGSPADEMARKSVGDAAKQIAKSIAGQFGRRAP